MKCRKLILSLFIIISLNSQSQEFTSFGRYAFISYEKIKIDSIINSNKKNQKKNWLNLLPNFNYDLRNKSFNIGLSLNTFSSYFQQKQRNKIELEKLKENLISKLESKLEKLQLQIEKFRIDKRILKNNINLFKINFDLFQISKGKYKNNEITSEEFLKLKLAYLSEKNSLNTSLLKLQIEAKKIQLKTKSDTLTVSLNILSNSINNYE